MIMGVFRKSTYSKSRIEELENQGYLPPRTLIKWTHCTNETTPISQEGRIVIFASLVKLSFRLPESRFLADVLGYFRIELFHLGPNSILILSVFSHLCEAFLGIPTLFVFFAISINPLATLEVWEIVVACTSSSMTKWL